MGWRGRVTGATTKVMSEEDCTKFQSAAFRMEKLARAHLFVSFM